MGYASHEGKAWVVEHLRSLPQEPEVFLDLGAGAGSWMEALKPWFLESRWLAMEVWLPYIDRFALRERYDLVIPGDIRKMTFPDADVVIMGDVLEHMSIPDALEVWGRARCAARMGVVTSIPIVDYHQGHVHGNPFQTHVVPDWSTERVLSPIPGITEHTAGEVVGTFWAPGWAEAAPKVEVVSP